MSKKASQKLSSMRGLSRALVSLLRFQMNAQAVTNWQEPKDRDNWKTYRQTAQ